MSFNIGFNIGVMMGSALSSSSSYRSSVGSESLVSLVEVCGFYIPDANNYYKTYEDIHREYTIQYFKFNGKYKCVAYGGDILKDNEISEIKSKIIDLKKRKRTIEFRFKGSFLSIKSIRSRRV